MDIQTGDRVFVNIRTKSGNRGYSFGGTVVGLGAKLKVAAQGETFDVDWADAEPLDNVLTLQGAYRDVDVSGCGLTEIRCVGVQIDGDFACADNPGLAKLSGFPEGGERL